MPHNPQLDRELEIVRAKAAAAAADKTGLDALAAGIRASLEHALAGLPRDLAQFEKITGLTLDPGSLICGMQITALAIAGTDANLLAAMPGIADVYREFVDRARNGDRHVLTDAQLGDLLDAGEQLAEAASQNWDRDPKALALVRWANAAEAARA